MMKSVVPSGQETMPLEEAKMSSRERITVNKKLRPRPAADWTTGLLDVGQEINQALAMTLGMHIHNRLEPLRATYLPEAAAGEFDAVIRYAIYDFFMNVAPDDRQLADLVASVPETWQVPGRDPLPTFD
jgi:hypothetical protein